MDNAAIAWLERDYDKTLEIRRREILGDVEDQLDVLCVRGPHGHAYNRPMFQLLDIDHG